VFIIKHKLSINIANKERHAIIMSRQQVMRFDHVLSTWRVQVVPSNMIRINGLVYM
jgi:hypothetical protein